MQQAKFYLGRLWGRDVTFSGPGPLRPCRRRLNRPFGFLIFSLNLDLKWFIWEKAGNRQLRQIHVATLKNPYNNSNRENHVSILTPSDSGTRRGNDWTWIW